MAGQWRQATGPHPTRLHQVQAPMDQNRRHNPGSPGGPGQHKTAPEVGQPRIISVPHQQVGHLMPSGPDALASSGPLITVKNSGEGYGHQRGLVICSRLGTGPAQLPASNPPHPHLTTSSIDPSNADVAQGSPIHVQNQGCGGSEAQPHMLRKDLSVTKVRHGTGGPQSPCTRDLSELLTGLT